MHSPRHEPITPELVLVDPELAERLRGTAPSTPEWVGQTDVLAERRRAPASQGSTCDDAEPISDEVQTPATPDRPRELVAPVEPPRPRRRRAPRPAALVVVLAAAALLLAGFLPPRQAPQLGESTSPASAFPSPLRLAWQPGGTRVALVEIFRGARLVHAASTTATTFDVPGWLAPGRYTWRVSRYGGQGRAVREPGVILDEGWFLIER